MIRGCSVWLFCPLVLCAEVPEKYTYWVEPCTRAESGCVVGDRQLAGWALRAWQKASAGTLEFIPVKDRDLARIRVFWATAEQGKYGEARPIVVDGKRGAEVYVRPAPFRFYEDRVSRDAVVYLTCLHETGHALGLPHTAVFSDIMYSFQYGGNIPEYFERYRRQLRTRSDIGSHAGLSEADRRAVREMSARP